MNRSPVSFMSPGFRRGASLCQQKQASRSEYSTTCRISECQNCQIRCQNTLVYETPE